MIGIYQGRATIPVGVPPDHDPDLTLEKTPGSDRIRSRNPVNNTLRTLPHFYLRFFAFNLRITKFRHLEIGQTFCEEA